MKTTGYQLRRIEVLGEQLFGSTWRDEVDDLCRKDPEIGLLYLGLENMSNTEAGWLVAELEDRTRNQ